MDKILKCSAYVLAFVCAVALVCSLSPPHSHAADGQSARGATPLGYQIDRQTVVHRPAVSSADMDDASAWGSVPEFGLNGRPNISVSARFSGTTGDTATIKIAYYNKTTLDNVDTLNYLGSSPVVTLTALGGIDQNDDNEAPITSFDGRGANMIKVIVLSISTGDVDLWVGSH